MTEDRTCPHAVRVLLTVLCLALAAGPISGREVERSGATNKTQQSNAVRKPKLRKWPCNEVVSPEGIPQPDPLRILILVRGIAYDAKYRGSANDYRRTYKNLFSHMVEPWRQQGHSVEIAISTFKSEQLVEVKEVYSPVFAAILRRPYQQCTKIHAVTAGLQTAQNKGGSSRWDFIAVTRFDLEMRQPITAFAIDYRKINFPWREKNWKDEPWSVMPRVADAMQLFPSKYLVPIVAATRELIHNATKRGNKRSTTYNNCHRLLMAMQEKGTVDLKKDVNFLLRDICASRWNRPNAVYREAVGEEQAKQQPGLGKQITVPYASMLQSISA